MTNDDSKNPEKSKLLEHPIKAGSSLSTLRHHRQSTVHPNLILRTPIFTPVGRTSRAKGRVADLSSAMREITFARTEGYDDVKIFGSRLNIDTDFKIWTGIVRAFEQYGFQPNGLEMSFSEFSRLCGYPSSAQSTVLKTRVDTSLTRIMSQVITFSAGSKTHKTHLLQSATYDIDANKIKLVPDERLWELYRIDPEILLSLATQEALQRRETAQCLYMFIHALPKNPAPLAFSRIRSRLCLTGTEAEVNRSIVNGLAELEKIGCLDYALTPGGKGKDRCVIIKNRKRGKQ